jgi:hypothetical protein
LEYVIWNSYKKKNIARVNVQENYRVVIGQRQDFHEHPLAVAPLSAAQELAERPHAVLPVHHAIPVVTAHAHAHTHTHESFLQRLYSVSREN